jgi:alpha-galactosidase
MAHSWENPDQIAGAEIRLVDLNEERLAMVLEWCEFARRRLGYEHKISAHMDLKEGLRGATACLTAISVGGDRLWRYDSTHPQLDGIFQAVGDTTGPGGAIRALRHAPAMRGIAETLAEVGAPNALLLQLTNPLNALTACLDHIPGIRVYGFCHPHAESQNPFDIYRCTGCMSGAYSLSR